jgi:hypothetical protein
MQRILKKSKKVIRKNKRMQIRWKPVKLKIRIIRKRISMNKLLRRKTLQKGIKLQEPMNKLI